jgi:hypothetical protein
LHYRPVFGGREALKRDQHQNSNNMQKKKKKKKKKRALNLTDATPLATDTVYTVMPGANPGDIVPPESCAMLFMFGSVQPLQLGYTPPKEQTHNPPGGSASAASAGRRGVVPASTMPGAFGNGAPGTDAPAAEAVLALLAPSSAAPPAVAPAEPEALVLTALAASCAASFAETQRAPGPGAAAAGRELNSCARRRNGRVQSPPVQSQ